jgi:predicted RNA-binding Zn-ribbon protein involved in translation (DUF1610 family)
MGWFFFSRPKPPPKPPRRHKVDDGLWVRIHGPQSLTVEASLKWYEGYEDRSPISADSLEEFRSWNLVHTGCYTEGDAVAIRTVMWNSEFQCPRCGDETVHDDVKCVHCGARLWRQRLAVDLVQVAK